ADMAEEVRKPVLPIRPLWAQEHTQRAIDRPARDIGQARAELNARLALGESQRPKCLYGDRHKLHWLPPVAVSTTRSAAASAGSSTGSLAWSRYTPTCTVAHP